MISWFWGTPILDHFRKPPYSNIFVILNLETVDFEPGNRCAPKAQMDIDYTFAQMLYLCIAPRSAGPRMWHGVFWNICFEYLLELMIPNTWVIDKIGDLPTSFFLRAGCCCFCFRRYPICIAWSVRKVYQLTSYRKQTKNQWDWNSEILSAKTRDARFLVLSLNRQPLMRRSKKRTIERNYILYHYMYASCLAGTGCALSVG